MRRKRKTKNKIIIFLSIYVFFFLSFFTIPALARYTNILNRNGSISVAKWSVSVTGEDNKELPTMIIGHSDSYQSYELSVTSKSEIAVNYSVVISNVPTGVKVQVDDDVIYNENKNIITISNLGNFSANDKNSTHNHKFTILVPYGVDAFMNRELDIDVVFNQVNL